MKFFCSALVAVPVALIVYTNTAWGQRPPESVTITKEFEFRDSQLSSFLASQPYSFLAYTQ